ncbi:CaiB/BaiF CoA transferase family protein [Streptomyces sp. NPDC004609]|uniref:CaiB/BaiF CoA transferase family protein n=1 Tax=Streptomyces sp. NPDC004609 TaxID=3364704 RepID=UPI0036B83140
MTGWDARPASGPGPLYGVRVLEIASLAPAPFTCMVLADLGADILRIDRVTDVDDRPQPTGDPLHRGRRSVAVDLKNPDGAALVRRLAATADVFVEGFRPGVTERLGIGPADLRAANRRLVYGRMTGWGQTGPLAHRAGHDINYIGLAGALEPIGRAGERPVPPLNLVGDFGGGGMLLAVGILAALYEREHSGLGQVVDAAMVDGAALLTAPLHGLRATGQWDNPRGHNLLDGGAPFYDTYETADGRYMAVGALEPHFYAQLLAGLGLADADLPEQDDRDRWSELRARFTAAFATRTRDEWTAVFDGTDACVTPVLSPWEAHLHPHNAARGVFTDLVGSRQPAPAPRLERTAGTIGTPAPAPGQDTAAALLAWGVDAGAVADLTARGAVAERP